MKRRYLYPLGALAAVTGWGGCEMVDGATVSAHQASLTLRCDHVRAEKFLYPSDATYVLTVDGASHRFAPNGTYGADLNPQVGHTASLVITPGADKQGAYNRTLTVEPCVQPTTTTTTTTVPATTTTGAPPSTSTTSTTASSTSVVPTSSVPSTSPTTPPSTTTPSADSSTTSASTTSSTPSTVVVLSSTTTCQAPSTNSETSPSTTVSDDCGTHSPVDSTTTTPSRSETSAGTSKTVCRMVDDVPTQVTPWQAWTQHLDHLCPLPSTGRDTTGLIAAAIAALLGGTALVVVARPRTS